MQRLAKANTDDTAKTSGFIINRAIAHQMGVNIVNVKDLVNELVMQLDRLNQVCISLQDGISIRDELRRYEIELIRMALRITSNHQLRAARLLRMNATTLNSKIKRHNIKV